MMTSASELPKQKSLSKNVLLSGDVPKASKKYLAKSQVMFLSVCCNSLLGKFWLVCFLLGCVTLCVSRNVDVWLAPPPHNPSLAK